MDGSYHLQVGDVTVLAKYCLSNLYPHFFRGDGPVLGEAIIGFGEGEPEIKDNVLRGYVRNDGNIFMVSRYIGFLAGQLSDRYMFCHGAGINVYGKGVLILGNSGSGKSTIVSMLEGKVLHDDFLMVSSDRMRRVSRDGIKTTTYSGRKSFQRLEDNNNSSSLDYVFILDKDQGPEHKIEIDPVSIPREKIFDDRFPSSFFEMFQTKEPIKFNSRVFYLGTKSNPEISKKIIEKIIN